MIFKHCKDTDDQAAFQRVHHLRSTGSLNPVRQAAKRKREQREMDRTLKAMERGLMGVRS